MHLSDIELYYSTPDKVTDTMAVIEGDEYNHIVNVMRHKNGDELFITNGNGKIFRGLISGIDKTNLSVKIDQTFKYENTLNNIVFCIPKIKSADRFEFALEKCVELGITNFIVFTSGRSYKKGEKTERWNKILLSAMKQSLLSYLSHIEIANSLKDISALPGEKIVLEQNSKQEFRRIIFEKEKRYYLIFGPEGGLTSEELDLFDEQNRYKLLSNRLRTETAVITSAVLISSSITL